MNYDPYGDIKYFEPFELPFNINSSLRWVEVKKCHWCGEKDIIVTFDNIEDNDNKIICPSCQCIMQDYTKIYRKVYRKLLLKKWLKSFLGI